MNGLTARYREALAITPGPISLKDIHMEVDQRGILKYAHEKGVTVPELSEEEKAMFIINV